MPTSLLASAWLALGLLATMAQADRNVTVSADSSSLVYFPGVCDNRNTSDCSGYWHSVQPINPADVFHYTASVPNAACTLVWQGSAIYFYTTYQTYPSVADISLDGTVTRGVTWSSPSSSILPNLLAWSATGLDPTVNHTISVIYSAIGYTTTAQPHYLDISSFTYTVPDSLPRAQSILPTAITASRPGSTMTGPVGPQTSSAAPSHSPSNDHDASRSSTAAIVGGVLGGLLAIVLVFVAWLLWRRRKQQASNRVSILPTGGRERIDAGSTDSVPFPDGRPQVFAFDTPPISPVSPAAGRPYGRLSRYSTDGAFFRPPYAGSEHDSSVIARGSHFSSAHDEMVERGSVMSSSVVGGQGSHIAQREYEVGDTKEPLETGAHIANPDVEGPPAYERDV